MDKKERLKVIENMVKNMTPEEIDDFINDIYLDGESSATNYSWGKAGSTYGKAFEKEVDERN